MTEISENTVMSNRRIPWNKGLSETRPEVIEKMRVSHLGNTSHLGYFHTDETKEKIKKTKCEQNLKYWEGKKRPNVSGENNYRWKGGPPKCMDCGRELANRKSPRCRKCAGINVRGEKHYNWKGGISKDVHSIGEPNYKVWRNAVFERDDWMCRMCGKKNCYLEAHHILSWSENPELRYVVENGLSLCRPCHVTTDNYRGKKRHE